MHEAPDINRIVNELNDLREQIRKGGPVIDPAFEAYDVGLEELVLGYMGEHAGPALAHLSTVGEGQ